MAELQRKDLLERTSQGKARAVKSGKFSGGMILFGFDILDDRLAPNPEESKLIQ
jgi:DNA invertase Pin-like site-specific DNA recombinase